jgi:hypothetical protein
VAYGVGNSDAGMDRSSMQLSFEHTF